MPCLQLNFPYYYLFVQNDVFLSFYSRLLQLGILAHTPKNLAEKYIPQISPNLLRVFFPLLLELRTHVILLDDSDDVSDNSFMGETMLKCLGKDIFCRHILYHTLLQLWSPKTSSLFSPLLWRLMALSSGLSSDVDLLSGCYRTLSQQVYVHMLHQLFSMAII